VCGEASAVMGAVEVHIGNNKCRSIQLFCFPLVSYNLKKHKLTYFDFREESDSAKSMGSISVLRVAVTLP
jgi:hypothetical protein